MREKTHSAAAPAVGLMFLLAGLAAPACLPAQPEATFQYVGQFGSRAIDGPAGTFYYPLDVDADSHGNLLISEWGNSRVQRCTTHGECEVIVSGLANQPDSIAVDEQDRIILSEDHFIRICENTGDCSAAFGGFGSAVGQFNNPRGIAIDSQGRIVVTDRYNNRVQFCDYVGNCSAFGTYNPDPDAMPGEFWEPASVATDENGTIFIGETGTEVVSVCNESGACSARLGKEGSAVGQFKTPRGLGLTSQGDLVVSEVSNHRLQLCSLSGECIAYGRRGEGAGEFRSPTGIYVDSADRVYIADQDNHRIQILQVRYGTDAIFGINAGLNDAWFNPSTAGQGFLITVYPDLAQMFLAWFTYDIERPPEDTGAILGEPGHRWLTAQGPYSGDTATLTVNLTFGGVFDAAEPPALTDLLGYGSITLQFADCTQGILIYEIESLGLSGEIPIERLSSDNEPLCEELGGQ